MVKNDLSYESSKWYVKAWRTRWYLYAVILHIKEYINLEILIGLLMNNEIEDSEKEKLKKSWKDIKRHVELSKLHKYSSK